MACKVHYSPSQPTHTHLLFVIVCDPWAKVRSSRSSILRDAIHVPACTASSPALSIHIHLEFLSIDWCSHCVHHIEFIDPSTSRRKIRRLILLWLAFSLFHCHFHCAIVIVTCQSAHCVSVTHPQPRRPSSAARARASHAPSAMNISITYRPKKNTKSKAFSIIFNALEPNFDSFCFSRNSPPQCPLPRPPATVRGSSAAPASSAYPPANYNVHLKCSKKIDNPDTVGSDDSQTIMRLSQFASFRAARDRGKVRESNLDLLPLLCLSLFE